MSDGLPAGWERIDEAVPYVKLVKRDAVTVPKRHAGGEPFSRDAVVVVTDEKAGVTTGPGARQSWPVPDPEAAGCRLAHAIEAWIDDGGDPYGGSDLNEELEAVV